MTKCITLKNCKPHIIDEESDIFCYTSLKYIKFVNLVCDYVSDFMFVKTKFCGLHFNEKKKFTFSKYAPEF